MIVYYSVTYWSTIYKYVQNYIIKQRSISSIYRLMRHCIYKKNFKNLTKGQYYKKVYIINYIKNRKKIIKEIKEVQ